MQNLGAEAAKRIAAFDIFFKALLFVTAVALVPVVRMMFPQTYGFVTGFSQAKPGFKQLGLSADVPPPKSKAELETEEV